MSGEDAQADAVSMVDVSNLKQMLTRSPPTVLRKARQGDQLAGFPTYDPPIN